MTGDVAFIKGRTTVAPVHIQMPDGAMATATQSETVTLPVWSLGGSTTLTLRGVLHVPGTAVNLFSVQAIMPRGFTATFRDGGVSINGGAGQVLVGVRAGAVHILPTAYDPPWEAAESGTPGYAGAAVGAEILHRRFGNCGVRDLTGVGKVTDGMLVAGAGIKGALSKGCKSCRVAKQIRAPYHASVSHSIVFLGLVHTDVGGPMVHMSIDGALYWVTIIDDYTKMAEVVPIQSKDEAARAAQHVVTLWETQTGKKLQRLRSDSGGEYIGAGMQAWLAGKGVEHEKTAPYSPQQNGKAERYSAPLGARRSSSSPPSCEESSIPAPSRGSSSVMMPVQRRIAA